MDEQVLGRVVRTYDAVESTNETLKELIDEGVPEGTVVVAKRQVSGRGRHGRAWFSPPGGLYASILLQPPEREVLDTFRMIAALPHLVCTLLYAWLLVVSTTGILIAAPHADGGVEAWGASLLRPIEVWLSGITTVRNVHRFVMWWFVCFTLAHVYMAVWNSMRTGNLVIEGIISGFEAESVDVREYDPTADERKGTGKA